MLASVLALATFTGRGQIPRLRVNFFKKVGSKEEKVEHIGSNVLGLMKRKRRNFIRKYINRTRRSHMTQ